MGGHRAEAMEMDVFDRLIWLENRVLLDDLVFRLVQSEHDGWSLGPGFFWFYKLKPLVDQYASFWASRDRNHFRNIVELGIWDGGSVALWCEHLRPHKHVAIDIQKKTDSEYFRNYVASRRLEETLRTYWETDQGDRERLNAICRHEFQRPLDLVIDDASHMYAPTRASFEVLFPRLRPGGFYMIEDWAWAYWEEFRPPHPWSNEIPLARLVMELVEIVGGSSGDASAAIASVTIYQGFTVVERGRGPCEGPGWLGSSRP
jgi:hypothetical protein